MSEQQQLHVLRNIRNRKFVANRGQTFTADLQHARIYQSLDAAKRNACGDEEPVPLVTLLKIS